MIKNANIVIKRRKLKRLRKPSRIQQGNSEKLLDYISEQAGRRRRKETVKECQVIHGGTDENNVATFDGMWYTLVNEATPQRLTTYLSDSKKITKVVGPVIQKKVTQFEESEENIARSVKVLYSKGLLSKAKYKDIRLNLSMYSNKKKKGRVSYKILDNMRMPKLLTYDNLIKYIFPINIGDVKSLKDFCYDVGIDDEEVNGAYRELDDFLPILADLFITIDQQLGCNSYLLRFGAEHYKFCVAIGADGAPFGKHDEATAWLLSFINSGDRITSQNENFLIAGANCIEDHICMKRYAQTIANDIQVIEAKEYLVSGYKVTFSFEIIPSDMKWLASFSGEISNSAYYFSSFGNVNTDNKHVVNGSLGPGPDTTWQPWVYENRLEVAKKVSSKKHELNQKNLSDVTRRNKILEFMKAQASRQEFPPLFGNLVDKSYAEPLHNSNNAWQFLHGKLLEIAIAKSNIKPSCINISLLPSTSPIRKFVKSLSDEVKASRLKKKFPNGLELGVQKNLTIVSQAKRHGCCPIILCI